MMPSVNSSPIARSKSSPGVRMVTVTGAPLTRTSSGSSATTSSSRRTGAPAFHSTIGVVWSGCFMTCCCNWSFRPKPEATRSIMKQPLVIEAGSRRPALVAPAATPDRLFVVGARIPSGRAAVPRGVVGPRPALLDRAARHRPERPRLRGGPFIDVHDESHEHHQRRYVVQHVADVHERTAEGFRKPHRNPGDQEDDGARDDRPEVQLLSAVE